MLLEWLKYRCSDTHGFLWLILLKYVLYLGLYRQIGRSLLTEAMNATPLHTGLSIVTLATYASVLLGFAILVDSLESWLTVMLSCHRGRAELLRWNEVGNRVLYSLHHLHAGLTRCPRNCLRVLSCTGLLAQARFVHELAFFTVFTSATLEERAHL